MREGCKSSGASEAWGSGAGKFLTRVGRCGGDDEADRRGPRGGDRGRRQPAREGMIRKGKRISREDATDVRAGWAGRALSACGGGVAGGLAGPEAKRAAGSAGPKTRKNDF
jgi:hypothetical protein